MKRKSFGKLAIVTLLAVAMLLGLCVCSKKAETKPATTATTTTNAKVETTQPSTTTTVAKAEEPAPAPTPAVEVKAEEVKEEPKEEVKVEEPVVETTPEVVEEAKVEEPVVEEEVASEETPIFSTLFTYNGVTSSIVAYSNHATVSIPSGVTESDIAYLASLLVSAYPEASKVTYAVVDGNLELTYPEQAGDFIVAAISTLETDAKAVIDALTAPVEPEVEEVTVAEVSEEPEAEDTYDFSIDEDGTIRASYNYHNLATASIVMTDTEATITYPAEYIYKSDIVDFFANVVEAFPFVKDYVTYSIPEDGTLILTYPSEVVDTTYEKVEVLAYLDDAVTEYADAILGSFLNALDSTTEEAVATEETTAEEDVPVFASIFTYKGITSNIIAYSDYALISIPAGVTEDDINAIAAELVAAYPEASVVTYALDDANIVLTYPEQSDAFVLAAVTQLESDARWLIDQLTPATEEVAIAEVKTEEEAPLFSTIFTYKGVTSYVVAYSDHALISIPDGVTEADINTIASELVAAYPIAKAVTYDVEDNNIVLTYPEENGDFIASAVTQLESDARWLIDQLTPATEEVAVAKVEEVAPVVEEVKEAPVETAKAEEPVAPVVAPEVPASPVETVEVVAPSAPVAAPVAQKESFIKGYTASITATPKANVSSVWEKPFVVGFGGRFALDFGKFSVGVKASYDLSAYMPVALYGKYNAVELGNGNLYVLGAAGANIGLNGRTTGALFELGVGYEYNFSEMFSAFAEVTGQYTTNNKFEVGATLGASVKF